MGEVDLTHLKATDRDKDISAVLRSASKTFANDKRFNKLTHGGAKIVTAVLEVVKEIFERKPYTGMCRAVADIFGKTKITEVVLCLILTSLNSISARAKMNWEVMPNNCVS